MGRESSEEGWNGVLRQVPVGARHLWHMACVIGPPGVPVLCFPHC